MLYGITADVQNQSVGFQNKPQTCDRFSKMKRVLVDESKNETKRMVNSKLSADDSLPGTGSWGTRHDISFL